MQKNNSLLFILILVAVFIIGGGIVYFTNPQRVAAPGNQEDLQQDSTQTQTSETTQTTQPSPPPSGPLSSRELIQTCTTDMATQFHIHQHLVILVEGKPVAVPGNIGIDTEKNCMSPIHTHEQGGILHVESPIKVDFKLSDFFFNWKIPFDKTQFSKYKVDEEYGMKFYVNGVESDQFENLILQDYQEIVIVYYKLSDGPGKLPPPFVWGNA